MALALLLVALLLTSCHTQYVAMPEVHTKYVHDTIIRADSIYVSHYESYHPSPSGEGVGVRLVTDTVLKFLYRDKVVEVIKHDSIPYPVEVQSPPKRKPLLPFHREDAPRFYKWSTMGFWLLFLCISLYIFLRIYLHR